MPLTTPAPTLTKLAMDFRSPQQGWSEGHWMIPVSQTALKAAAAQIIAWRLALLPPSCSLVYAKTSGVGRPADAIPVKQSYPVIGLFPGDPFTTPATAPPAGSINIEMSQIAVSLRVWAADGTDSQRWVHAIPDNRVTAEVLTDAIEIATAPPPDPATLTPADSWPTRFGMYMYILKANTVLGASRVSTTGVRTWYSGLIDDMMVSGIVVKKTGAPFRQQAGHRRVG